MIIANLWIWHLIYKVESRSKLEYTKAYTIGINPNAICNAQNFNCQVRGIKFALGFMALNIPFTVIFKLYKPFKHITNLIFICQKCSLQRDSIIFGGLCILCMYERVSTQKYSYLQSFYALYVIWICQAMLCCSVQHTRQLLHKTALIHVFQWSYIVYRNKNIN